MGIATRPQEGATYHDGTIFIRNQTEAERARQDDINRLVERSASQGRAQDSAIDFQFVGSAVGQPFLKWLEKKAVHDHVEQVQQPLTSHQDAPSVESQALHDEAAGMEHAAFADHFGISPRLLRSFEEARPDFDPFARERRQQLEGYPSRMHRWVRENLVGLLTSLNDPIILRATNHTDRWIRNVEVRLTLGDRWGLETWRRDIDPIPPAFEFGRPSRFPLDVPGLDVDGYDLHVVQDGEDLVLDVGNLRPHATVEFEGRWIYGWE